ncbi:unnamed protein product [Fusarium graminearum]|uniref:Uncharacterized protein n=1 Tax=Gibberella zeae TaxID=5518 RepID=A0A4U9ETS6_GIBZA|nr:unnamed protein product [Fusarium graminearum]CAG1991183.1 unnamed protein product [Fusarium graminearum]CAG1992059.1 unnamed protein product [Fusarium graminearum]VTO86589.1 unnamed protein product [Fusarium graminearum]
MVQTRRGGMPDKRARRQSQTHQIGQLDTTPTSRHLQSPQVDNNHEPPPSAQPQESANEYDDDVDDEDLIRRNKQVFESEGASTRRSTPIDSHFDDSSSQKSGSGKLPSTQPLPSQLISGNLTNKVQPLVDFSETATTARRSSPYPLQTTLSQAADDMPKYNTVFDLPSTIPESLDVPGDHLPEDELYDTTPVPEDREEQAAAEKQTAKPKSARKSTKKGKATDSSEKAKASIRVLEEEVGSVEEEPSSFPPRPVVGRQKPAKNAKQVQESPKPAPASVEATTSGTRRKQKPKPPLRFNSQTNQMIDPSSPQFQPARPSLVEGMIQAYAASLSPDTNATKPTPKPAKKVSPKTVAKRTSKNSPKTTSKTSPKAISKTTPKAGQKAPAISQRITRQSALRGRLNQQSPDKVDEANSNGSPAAAPVEPKEKISPAVSQRTTRTKVKEETAPVLPPSKEKEIVNHGNTQGSTDDPIVLSSGRNSSSPYDDDEFVPATDPTEVSPEEARPDTVAQAKRQSLVDPVEPLSVTRNEKERIVAARQEIPKPMRPFSQTGRQFTAQNKKIFVRADPQNQVEAGFERTNRERPIRIGPGEILLARDAHALAQRHASKLNVLKRPPSTRDPVVDTSKPLRKVMKRSRSFSQDYLSGLEAAESMPVKAQVAEEKLQQQERSSDKRWRREASGHNQDLHAQIMASLQGRDESSPEVHDEKPDMTPEEELAESTRPKGPSDEVEEKLHGLVKTLLGHLQTREATIYEGADAYRKNGIDSVEKIKRRYLHEKKQLGETWKKDAERFVRGSRSIKAALDKRGKAQEEARHKLEETLARRRHLFQKATTSLRALHGRLTEHRDEVNDE